MKLLLDETDHYHKHIKTCFKMHVLKLVYSILMLQSLNMSLAYLAEMTRSFGQKLWVGYYHPLLLSGILQLCQFFLEGRRTSPKANDFFWWRKSFVSWRKVSVWKLGRRESHDPTEEARGGILILSYLFAEQRLKKTTTPMLLYRPVSYISKLTGYSNKYCDWKQFPLFFRIVKTLVSSALLSLCHLS